MFAAEFQNLGDWRVIFCCSTSVCCLMSRQLIGEVELFHTEWRVVTVANTNRARICMILLMTAVHFYATVCVDVEHGRP